MVPVYRIYNEISVFDWEESWSDRSRGLSNVGTLQLISIFMAPATLEDRSPKTLKSVSYQKPSLPPKNPSSLGPSSRKNPDKLLKEKAKRNADKGKAREEDNTQLPTSFKLVAGSYEKLLYGLDGQVTLDEEEKKLHFHLLPIFIFPAHVSCIKAVAASPHGGKWLATGSADEIIKIWDLRRRKEVGGLMHHEGNPYF